MKRLILVLCVFALALYLCGCSSFLGGMNQREIGEYTYLFTDGEKEYFKYFGAFEDGYAVIDDGEYSLYEGVLPDTVIFPEVTDAEVILTAYKSALYGGPQCAKEYDYLGEQIESIFGTYEEEKYYEALLLKSDEIVYGAVNIYSRPSGRSGNLLANENLEKSCLLSCMNGELDVAGEFEDTAILAFNQTHFIAYRNKTFYSVNIKSREEKEICTDAWWDKGPTYYNWLDVRFTDEYFQVYACYGSSFADKVTLIVGKMDGSSVETLIDNEKVNY